jgi:hypothetical protein
LCGYSEVLFFIKNKIAHAKYQYKLCHILGRRGDSRLESKDECCCCCFCSSDCSLDKPSPDSSVVVAEPKKILKKSELKKKFFLYEVYYNGILICHNNRK